jgi:hypothetical protein
MIANGMDVSAPMYRALLFLEKKNWVIQSQYIHIDEKEGPYE